MPKREDKWTVDQRKMIHCKDCGKNIEGCVRIQNDKLGYVKCLKCGLGVERSKNQPC